MEDIGGTIHILEDDDNNVSQNNLSKRKKVVWNHKLKPHVSKPMGTSIVFDISTCLQSKDPGPGIEALKSSIVLGKSYPTTLLFSELTNVILKSENVSTKNAYEIYDTIIFACDKVSDFTNIGFPEKLSDVTSVLSDVVLEEPDDALHTRRCLALQAYIYVLQANFRYTKAVSSADKDWLGKTQMAKCLGTKKEKQRNTAISNAITHIIDFWSLFEDDDNTCLALLRLLEMLSSMSDQMTNLVQRIEGHLDSCEFSEEKKTRFFDALQFPTLKTCIATSGWGLTKSARCKDNYWPMRLGISHLNAKFLLSKENDLDSKKDKGKRDMLEISSYHLDALPERGGKKSRTMDLVTEIMLMEQFN